MDEAAKTKPALIRLKPDTTIIGSVRL